MIPESFQLRHASRPLRLFLTAFLLVLTLGYVFGLSFVHHTTSLSPGGVVEQFRGNQSPDVSQKELKYEKSLNEMLTFTHNHILSLTLLFFVVGGILLCSSIISDGWKTFLIVEPFVAIVTTFGGLWLLRFTSPWLVWLVVLSGITMLVCYLASIYLILKELWFKKV